MQLFDSYFEKENIYGYIAKMSECENNASGQKGVALLTVFSPSFS